MAKIKLTESGFSLIPEGTTVFKIVGVEYKEDFGKMNVEMQTKDGKKHTERFTFLNKKGEINEKSLKVFSYFAKTALNNFSLDEIDETDLIGCYIQANVKHEDYDYINSDGERKTGTSARLNDYAVSVGFGSGATEASNDSDDLDDFDLDDLDDDSDEPILL